MDGASNGSQGTAARRQALNVRDLQARTSEGASVTKLNRLAMRVDSAKQNAMNPNPPAAAAHGSVFSALM